MEWQQIVGFYQLVRQGSFTKAADASHRTQSALSQQIRKLEDELQCQLIDRISRKKFVLTPAGEKVYQFAERVVGDHEKLGEDLASLKGLQRGRLRIAAPFTTLYHLFPGHFRSFLEAYPHVEMTIFDRHQARAIEMLRAGEIDIAVVLKSLVPADLDVRTWKKVEPVLMVPDRHPLLRSKRVLLADVARYPLILPPKDAGSAGRNLLEKQRSEKGIDYRVIMESDNVELTSRYVEAGAGISFATIAEGLNPLKGRKIRFLPMPDCFRTDSLSVVTRPGKPLPLHAERFISQILGS